MPCIRLFKATIGPNKGNDVQSILYDQLAEDYSESEADIIYNRLFTEEFKNLFGDWQFAPSSFDKKLNENGEPLIRYIAYTKTEKIALDTLYKDGAIGTYDDGLISILDMDKVRIVEKQFPKHWSILGDVIITGIDTNKGFYIRKNLRPVIEEQISTTNSEPFVEFVSNLKDKAQKDFKNSNIDFNNLIKINNFNVNYTNELKNKYNITTNESAFEIVLPRNTGSTTRITSNNKSFVKNNLKFFDAITLKNVIETETTMEAFNLLDSQGKKELFWKIKNCR